MNAAWRDLKFGGTEGGFKMVRSGVEEYSEWLI